MFRIFLALGLISLSGCASASNLNVSDSESITNSNTDIVDIKPEEAPYDLWERIRLELSITIPDDQIAATLSLIHI